MEDDAISIQYTVTPCDASGNCSIDSSKTISGNLRFTEMQQFKLTIKNTSGQRIYFNLIDIDPTNALTWGNPKKNLFRNVELMMNEQKVFTITLYKPYGVEQMKIIATDRPVDFSSLQENGSSLTRGAENNPLLQFVDHAVNGTRGAEGSDPGGATIKTLTSEIMKKQ